jgi:Zn2+/Cd2+-exporting ATPase
VRVGLQSEMLTVSLSSPNDMQKVEKAVRDLGYDISPKPAKGTSAQIAAPAHAEGDGHDHDHDHDDHGEPIEGAWWRSPKGLLVLITGAFIGLAYLVGHFWESQLPFGASGLFYVATFIGTFPVAKRALAALRGGSLFTIEMLMTIAVVGAIFIGATEEAAIVVALFALGELLEGIAAGRARSGIKALAQIAPKTAMLETPSGLVETPIAQILGSRASGWYRYLRHIGC